MLEMPPSFRKIDYALRPAKHTERRMLCDILRKLSAFGSLTDYIYVGFGAITFTDFTLFHKALGIIDMISIERSVGALQRLKYNKPFSTITLINKTSSAALPLLKWGNPHIIWLDYDDPLNLSMFDDVGIVADHANSGTALAFSFQCNKATELEVPIASGETYVHKFTSNYGRDRVPANLDETDLTGWRFGDLGAKMLIDEINSILATRNASLEDEADRIKFKMLANIKYSDNALMQTIVGVFVSGKDTEKVEAAKFNDLDFLERGNSIKIEVPKLTLREIRFLEQQLPLRDGSTLDSGSIPSSDAKAFKELYRYLPNFSVLET